jgi:hypothetical protein
LYGNFIVDVLSGLHMINWNSEKIKKIKYWSGFEPTAHLDLVDGWVSGSKTWIYF